MWPGSTATTCSASTGCTIRTTQRGGHQPFGWDQLRILYERYKVYGVRVSGDFWLDPDDTTEESPIQESGATLFFRTSSSSTREDVVALTAMHEDRGWKSIRLDPPVRADVGSGNPQTHWKGSVPLRKHYTRYFLPWKVLGQQFNDADYSISTSATVPTGEPIQFLGIYNTPWSVNNNDSVAVHFKIRFDYLVKFYDPVALTGS